MNKALCIRTLSLSLVGAVGMFAQTVPQAYQAIYNNMTTQISTFQATLNAGWNKSAYPVSWAPHLSSAESDQFTALLGANYYQQTVLVELQELQATGAKAVTVHIGFPILYQPFYTYSGQASLYPQFVSFYQQLASDVHSRGLKLVVEATVSEPLDGTQGSAFEPYYQSLDWNEFITDRAQNAVNTAKLLKPDYLSLLCEPDTESVDAYQPNENSPTGALQLLQGILSGFEQANVTGVTLGAGAGTWIPDFTTYIQNFSTTSLSYIDMHVYPVNDADLTNVLTGSTLIQKAGKMIGVSEAWPNKMSASEAGNITINTVDSRDAFSFWSPVDTAFLQAMVDCAQYQKFAFFSPSYPQYFAAYLNYAAYGNAGASEIVPAASVAATNANRSGAFTPTGLAFVKMLVGTDKTAPTTPSAPTMSTISGTGVTLTWNLTKDNVGVAGYGIYRDGVLVAEQAMPPFYDTGLTPQVTYTYNLTAFDAQGNVSEQGHSLKVTTLDTTAPSVPANVKITGVETTQLTLNWAASTGTGGVGGYRVLKGSSPSTLAVVASMETPGYTDTHVAPATTYYYAVESYNTYGVVSSPSTTVHTETTAITPPTDLTASKVTNTSVGLSWKAEGATSYRLLRGISTSGMQIFASPISGATFQDSSVVAGETYYYEVESMDSLGYSSAPSKMLTVKVP